MTLLYSIIRMVRNVFWYFEPLKCGSRVWRKNGRTDGRTEWPLAK